MSNNLIKPGDTVVFAQRYIAGEPKTELHNRRGVVKSTTNDDYVIVEFNYMPGVPIEIFKQDLELVAPDELDLPFDEVLDTASPIEESEQNEELGGMSTAQLIASKLAAQETDPALDRTISILLN